MENQHQRHIENYQQQGPFVDVASLNSWPFSPAPEIVGSTAPKVVKAKDGSDLTIPPPPEDERYRRGIFTLEISVRLANALTAAGIVDFEQIYMMRTDLLKVPNIGKTSFEECTNLVRSMYEWNQKWPAR